MAFERSLTMADLSEARRQMVAHQIQERGVRSPAVARATRERLGYDNVHVIEGDGTRGWPEAAPYDAIVVAAGGNEVPPALRSQLAVGGRLVIPVGPTPREQRLVRVTRVGEDEFEQEDLLPVRFVPLIGEQGWQEAPRREARPRLRLPERIARAAESFSSIEEVELEPLLARIGEARVVLLGEATHGTSEFYRMRARITQGL